MSFANATRGAGDVRFGSKADICAATSHVRFTPNSDRKSGFPHKVMSALSPKADSCAASTIDQLVGAFEHWRRDSQTERSSGL
jgi:hypothetical protein